MLKFGNYTSTQHRQNGPQYIVPLTRFTSALPCAGHQYIDFLVGILKIDFKKTGGNKCHLYSRAKKLGKWRYKIDWCIQQLMSKWQVMMAKLPIT